MALRRRSQFRNRITKMQGLPIDEKMLLLRMGELIDGAINNRTPTNPNALRGHRKNKVVIATNLDSNVSARGAVLTWDKVDSSDLLHYKIRILPLDGSGSEVDATSYTNQFIFKGIAGSYKYNISVVNRNGQSGGWSADHFFDVQDSPMILEGNKLNIEDLGAQLSETVLCPLNYTVFAFASIVLNSFADPNDNPSVSLELRRGDTYESSVFIQQFDLYPESEDLCNFDTTVAITRPSGTPTRSGNFQTTQSVMFTPYQILEATGIADTNVKFWITATGHSDDIVGMSCAIWVASEGLSEEVVAGGGIVHDKAIQLPVGTAGTANRAFAISTGLAEGDTLINNVWTFAIWIKPQDLTTSNFRIYRSSRFNLITGVPNNLQRVTIDWTIASPRLEITVFNDAGSASVLWTKNLAANVWPLGINNWHLLTVCFNGTRAGSKFDVYVNGAVLTPTSDSSTATTIPAYTINQGRVWAIGGDPSGNVIIRTFATINTSLFTGRVHQAGLWDIVLSSSAVSAIYNSGNGARRNWLTTFSGYGNALDLIHYWQFGGLDNDRDGSPGNISEWVKKGGGTPTQAEVNSNIANDISFDLGNMRDGVNYHPLDFTNRIFIGYSVATDEATVNRPSIGGFGSFTFKMPDATDAATDYPGT